MSHATSSAFTWVKVIEPKARVISKNPEPEKYRYESGATEKDPSGRHAPRSLLSPVAMRINATRLKIKARSQMVTRNHIPLRRHRARTSIAAW